METMERIELFKELRTIMGFSAPRDGLLMIATRRWELDLPGLDKKMGQHLASYDSENCTYEKETNVSMQGAMKLAFGDRAVEIVKQLIG